MGMSVRKPSSPRGRRGSPRTSVRATTSLAAALFTTTQQRVLGLLYGQPERSFFATELIDLTGSGSGAVQRELARLSNSGLLTSRSVGRQRHYQANPEAPIYDELRSIVVKTTGYVDPLRAALNPLASRVRLALLYGSVAAGTAKATSDVDLLIVSDEITLEELYKALASSEHRLGRKISPTLYTATEYERRRLAENSFLTKVLAGTYISLIGDPRAVTTAR